MCGPFCSVPPMGTSTVVAPAAMRALSSVELRSSSITLAAVADAAWTGGARPSSATATSSTANRSGMACACRFCAGRAWPHRGRPAQGEPSMAATVRLFIVTTQQTAQHGATGQAAQQAALFAPAAASLWRGGKHPAGQAIRKASSSN